MTCDEQSELSVAFASSDLSAIDEHFGSATRLVVYRVTAGGAELQQVVSFDAVNHDGNEQKLPAKIAALSGCAAIFCQAVGGSAIKQLMASGVQPIKVNDSATIHETLTWLQSELKQPKTPWVVKALAQQLREESAGRFDAMAAEGWDS